MKNTDILSISKLNNVVSPCKHESTILTRNSTFTYLNYIYHVLICVPNMIKINIQNKMFHCGILILQQLSNKKRNYLNCKLFALQGNTLKCMRHNGDQNSCQL